MCRIAFDLGTVVNQKLNTTRRQLVDTHNVLLTRRQLMFDWKGCYFDFVLPLAFALAARLRGRLPVDPSPLSSPVVAFPSWARRSAKSLRKIDYITYTW